MSRAGKLPGFWARGGPSGDNWGTVETGKRLIENQKARIGVICTLGKPSKSKTLKNIDRGPATASRTAGAGDTQEIQRSYAAEGGDGVS